MLRWHGHMADDVGATDGREPMATLEATAAELVLSGNRGTFRLRRDEVTKIGRGGLYPWLFGALRIRHGVARLPSELQFKPLDATVPAVRIALKSLGYPTS